MVVAVSLRKMICKNVSHWRMHCAHTQPPSPSITIWFVRFFFSVLLCFISLYALIQSFMSSLLATKCVIFRWVTHKHTAKAEASVRQEKLLDCLAQTGTSAAPDDSGDGCCTNDNFVLCPPQPLEEVYVHAAAADHKYAQKNTRKRSTRTVYATLWHQMASKRTEYM